MLKIALHAQFGHLGAGQSYQTGWRSRSARHRRHPRLGRLQRDLGTRNRMDVPNRALLMELQRWARLAMDRYPPRGSGPRRQPSAHGAQPFRRESLSI